MKRKCVLYLWSLISAAVVYWIFAGLHRVLRADFGGDKGEVLAGIVFGLPLGSVTGIILAERMMYFEDRWNVGRVMFALLWSIAGVAIGIFMLEVNSRILGYFIPALIALMSLYGYESRKPTK